MTLEDAEDRIAELEEALLRVRQWCDAYPVNVFIPPTKEQIAASVEALKAPGCASSDALHGSWARHILNGVRGYTEIADRGNKGSE